MSVLMMSTADANIQVWFGKFNRITTIHLYNFSILHFFYHFFEVFTLKEGFFIVSGGKENIVRPLCPEPQASCLSLFYFSFPPLLPLSIPRPFRENGQTQCFCSRGPTSQVLSFRSLPLGQRASVGFPQTHTHNTHTLSHPNPLLLPFLLVCSWKS